MLRTLRKEGRDRDRSNSGREREICRSKDAWCWGVTGEGANLREGGMERVLRGGKGRTRPWGGDDDV